uniref:GAS domain-containing protein n=1 Tax=Angiostrongylus cantonensis TaxID=6313 RepID=A0A0K0D3G5_ANGCA
LNEANEMVRTLKTRVALSRLQVLQKDKELKDLLKERNDAYYSGVGTNPAERDQLLDPFFYETFIAMKEKIARREKEITELRETVKALEGGKDWSEVVHFAHFEYP